MKCRERFALITSRNKKQKTTNPSLPSSTLRILRYIANTEGVTDLDGVVDRAGEEGVEEGVDT